METERESAREARRRKILERGSARLAFITGETRSFTPSDVQFPAPPPHSNEIELEEDEGLPVVDVPIEREISGKEATFTASFQEKIEEAPESMPEITTEIEPEATFASFIKQEEIKASLKSTPETTRGIEPEAIAANTRPKPRKSPARIFTAQTVSSVISASEDIRLLCALSIAMLVTLSCHTATINVDNLGSIIWFRPIYVVIFSDLALLLGIIYSRAQEGLNERNRIQEGDEWFDKMGKALEVAIIFQKMVGAILSDSCLCAVIIVCGVSIRMSL